MAKKPYTPGAISRDFDKGVGVFIDTLGAAVAADLRGAVPVDRGDLQRGVGFKRTGDFRGVVSTGKDQKYAAVQNVVNPRRKGFGQRTADRVGQRVAEAFRAAFGR